MEFTLMFKTNDVLDQIEPEWFTEEEYLAAKDFAEQYVKYGEYINVHFDTNTGIVTVLKKS